MNKILGLSLAGLLAATVGQADVAKISDDLTLYYETAGTGDTELFMRMMSSVGASVGYDQGSPVSQRYNSPNPFQGTLHEVAIQLVSRADVEAQAAEARAEMSRQ